MKLKLQNGQYAHLRSVLQVTDYLGPYLNAPTDAIAEIKRLAGLFIPSAWKKANIELLGIGGTSLRDQLLRGELPAVLCICEIVAYRGPSKRPVSLHLVWMQAEFTIGVPQSIEQELAQLGTHVWDVQEHG